MRVRGTATVSFVIDSFDEQPDIVLKKLVVDAIGHHLMIIEDFAVETEELDLGEIRLQRGADA